MCIVLSGSLLAAAAEPESKASSELEERKLLFVFNAQHSALSFQPEQGAQAAGNRLLTTGLNLPSRVLRKINNLDIIHVANNRF